MAKTKRNDDYNDFLNRVNGYTTDWSNKYQNGNSKSTSSNNSVFNNSTSSSKSNKAYDVDFDTFYNRVQGRAKSWYEEYEVPRQQKELEEEIQKEVAKDAEQRARYFEVNKEALKEERKNSLIYNWSVDKSGGIDFDYNYMPVRDENGYAKKTDSKGNVYWVDLENDLLYDKNHKLINDNRLRDKNFIDSLKYEYDEKTGKVVNAEMLKNSDRIGLVKFDKSQYNFLVTNENDENKKKAEEWNNKYQFINQQAKDMYLESRKGLKTTPYGEGLQNAVDEKNIKTITKQNPYENKPSIYEEQFEKFNEAIEKGQFVKANNALQEINEKYFGHSYVDGWWDALFGDKDDDFAFFNNRFNKNVEKLNTINSSIKNTRDEETLKALYEEKNKLELENQLIQYNKLTYIQSDKELVRKMDSIMNPIDEAWNKVGQLWGETFSEFDDGYDFGDLFKTAKKTLNNTFQTIGALGKQTNAGIQGIEYMLISDMDEGEFKDTWAPAIMDVATYVIPYVGQARIIINYAEPGSVVGAGILREGSATIDSADGKPRVPDAKNVFGASVNIAANFASDYIFSKIRSKLNPETINNWYKSSAKTMITEILKEGVGEGAEEFIQTYAEYMQNMDGDMSFEFFKEHWSEAWKSAFIAFVTASGASFTTSSIGKIRSTVSGKQLEINEALKSYDAVDNIRVPKNIEAGEDIKVNEELSNDTNRSPYISNTTDTYEDMSYESDYNNDIIIEDDEDAVVNIAERLQNDEVITILNDSVLETDRDSNPEIDIQSNNNSNITVSDRVLYDNSKITIVPSKEMETYLKGLDNYNGNPIYVADPKSPTFMDDVKNYVNDIGKSNIVVKNNQDFNPNEYVLTPQEMNDINNMVTEYTNKANLLDNINNPSEFKLTPITVSDISDSDINTIVNTIKNKFLDELSKNRYSKETAIKEFKTLSGKLEGYLNNREQHRTYLSDNKNRIVTFYKTGPNLYEAANTLPKTMGDLYTLANVKTNGNVLNGNITSPIGLTKQQVNNVNNLISKLGLRGNFLTEKSSGRDVAELVKLNRGESKEILQALGADGLIEGKNKVRLYTAYDNLDNANPVGAIKNTVTYLASEKAKNELVIRSNTTAPKNTNIKKEPSNLPELNETVNVEQNAFDPENTTELNNIEAEEMFNDEFDKAWKQLKITDKKQVNKEEIKTWVKKMLFDRRVHINNIAIPNGDYNVRAALAMLDAVASDAQVMKEGAQIRNNEIVGKSLKDIFSPLKGKHQKELFQKLMMLELNIERENAGVDKVFENLSKEQSRKMADNILKNNPKFAEVAKDLQRYNNTLLDLLVDGGVINNDIATTLKNRYKYYMPIYSSDLSTFTNLADNKYIKALNIDDTIKDVTKTGKQIQSIEKSMENKTYNVLSAIAKNKLAQEMSMSNHYQGDSKADLIFYVDGNVTKMKTSNDIISDINRDDLSHIVDMISEVPIFKQMINMNKLSYKFILDPVYQIKNLVIDFTDSQLVYSKDKKNFAKNYIRAIIAVANNSEIYNEFKEIGLGKIGEGWKAPKVTYNEDGSVNVKQNKFQRIAANLEALPKLAEYMSLKEKYMKQARQDYEAGKYKHSINGYTKDDIVITNAMHGTDEKFDKPSVNFSGSKVSKTDSNLKMLVFTDNENTAKTYTLPRGKDGEHYTYKYSDIKDDYKDFIHYNSLVMKKPLIIDAKGRSYDTIDNTYNIKRSEEFKHFSNKVISVDELAEYAKVNGYDGLIVKNVVDTFASPTADEWFNMNIKKFKAMADDNGVVSKDIVSNDLRQTFTGTNYIVFDDSQILTDSDVKKLNDTNISIKDIQEQIKVKAKVEAQDVNLNFDSGGVASKALSKSGFKFLNAGMLGFDKFVTHVGEGVKTPKGMGRLLLEFTSIGATTAIANRILNGDDDDYDKLPYYYKNNYYMIKLGEDKWLRIPKGRVQTLYNVLFEYGTGIRTEDDAQTYIDSIKSAFELAVLPPALKESSPAAALQQVFENKDAFGNPIYSEDYDDTKTKGQKILYHILSSYLGRYGRIIKDATDNDGTTDVMNEFDYYKDTTKANRHYQTVVNLVDYYKKSDNVKTLDDKAMKKYIDTQNYALRTINSEISQGKKTGQTTDDLKMKYRARDDLLLQIINNHKDYTKEVDENGNTWYYFDDLTFMYNNKTGKFVKK